MSVFGFTILFVLLEIVVLEDLKLSLFLATNRMSVGENKFVSCLGELLETIF
jgi:hypothetical protein